MIRRGFSCRRCGHCCRNLVDAYRGCVSDADLRRWKRAGRDDILARVESLDLGRGNVLHTAWLDPETGEDAERCPWLAELPEGKGHSCRIEELKPQHCRDYPEHRRHAEDTGCPGYRPPRNVPPRPRRRPAKGNKMGKDLYVGNISFSATEDDIRKLFSLAGKVQSIHLMNDPKTGKFRGTGFVKLANVDAREAADLLDGTRLVDRVITVVEALPPKEREQAAAGERGKAGPDRKGRGRRR